MTSPSVAIDKLPPVLRATVYALLAALFFSGMAIFIRQASYELHPTVIVFFRNALALLWMLPWLSQAGLGALRTNRLGMFGLRTILGLIGMTSGFWAVTLIPISQATALSFTSPIFATIGAALILGEVVRRRRWTAVIVGFWGAMIVVIGNNGGLAGLGALELGVILALVNAVIMAINKLVLKSLTRTERPEAIITYMVLLLTPLSLILAVFHWDWPSFRGLFLADMFGWCWNHRASLHHARLPSGRRQRRPAVRLRPLAYFRPVGIPGVCRGPDFLDCYWRPRDLRCDFLHRPP